jgi:DNA-binding IclR family transcriptional regulator
MSLTKAGYAASLSRGVYVLGDEFLRLAFLNYRQRPLAAIIRPTLESLVARFGETAHYAVLDGQEIVYRDKVEPPNEAIKLMSTIGGRTPAYRTAVGKLLLAHRLHSVEDIRAWAHSSTFPARTERTITTVEGLHQEFTRIREIGYAVDDQENEPGVNCIAVPVMLKHEVVPTSAVSVSALVFRTKLDELIGSIEEIKEIVTASAPLSELSDIDGAALGMSSAIEGLAGK